MKNRTQREEQLIRTRIMMILCVAFAVLFLTSAVLVIFIAITKMYKDILLLPAAIVCGSAFILAQICTLITKKLIYKEKEKNEKERKAWKDALSEFQRDYNELIKK